MTEQPSAGNQLRTDTQLRVGDITSYLAEAGWQRQPQGWRGAGLWQHSSEYELLVPARDGLRDAAARLREIVFCLAEVEDRSPEDIADDIAHPFLDRQFFRTFPNGHESGCTSLSAGVKALNGIRIVLATAARTVLQGPHFSFGGQPPPGVGDVLRAAELGPSRAGSYVVELRLASAAEARGSDAEIVRGRAVGLQLFEAVAAAQAAVESPHPEAFDDAVTAGVSADLCNGLSELCGDGRDEPFEISFRWARAQPVRLDRQVVAFPTGSGLLLRSAARKLRSLNASGAATVSGVIESLHHGATDSDRWRIRVHGELRTARTGSSARARSAPQVEQARRRVWVRLSGQDEYDRAIAAHRDGRMVTVTGELSSATGRVELVPTQHIEF